MVSTNLIKMGTLTCWHADALCADTDQHDKEKTKEKMYLSVEYRRTNALACGCVDVQMHCVCVQTHEWRKKKEKRELTDGTGMDTQGHGHADGRVSVWTQMRCVWMRMSRKEKERKKNFVNANGRHVGLRKCCVWTRWRVDMDVLRADADE